MAITISEDYKWIIMLAACFHLLQSLLAIPVVRARMSSKIKAPILYPRDSEIKSRNLTEDQVLDYYNAQRGHQNNVEFSCTFIPLLLAAGLLPEITLSVAKAGALALGARFIGQFAYSQAPQFRQISGIWHIGEMYILYLVFSQTGLSFGWAMEGLM